MALKGKQIRFLRGLGHHLKPVVMVGKDEISEQLISAVQEALQAHELIKLKIQEGCLLDRKEVAQILAEKTAADVVQILGRTILLYQQGEEPQIELPR